MRPTARSRARRDTLARCRSSSSHWAVADSCSSSLACGPTGHPTPSRNWPSESSCSGPRRSSIGASSLCTFPPSPRPRRGSRATNALRSGRGRQRPRCYLRRKPSHSSPSCARGWDSVSLLTRNDASGRIHPRTSSGSPTQCSSPREWTRAPPTGSFTGKCVRWSRRRFAGVRRLRDDDRVSRTASRARARDRDRARRSFARREQTRCRTFSRGGFGGCNQGHG